MNDPYETLGVARDATEPEIKRAYREKAKSAHPDGGGDRETWDGISRALAVLTDPNARAHFDKTGKIDEPPIDNDRAAALQILHSQLDGFSSRYIAGGFQRVDDPRYLDLPAEMARLIQGEIGKAYEQISIGEKVLVFQQDFMKRFHYEGNALEDSISRALTNQISGTEQSIAKLHDAIRLHELALTILEAYVFDTKPLEQSAAYEPMWPSFGATMA